ncbi:hypothetical protein TWF730_010287 [Orbilia blumenaviensis]|uniref:RNA polymerase II assembly factor Rtp1 C-terminal domain-containing protein n=1 Tax=Orbilia blumenaviensis TaxID=1796055 RepID=A0AAV9UNM0_9PEZI
MDFIACLGELAFHPQTGSGDWQKTFYHTLDNIQTPLLLPLLVPLILPTTPPWFQKPLTTYLSGIPVTRPNGVKDEITFFIDPTKEITTQRIALQQASRLIGSVPTTSTPDQYFSVIAPQLLGLLGESGSLGVAAAIVINDVFERRKKGVEKYFFPTLLRPLRPAKSQIPPAEEIEPGDIITLTEDDDLGQAINRISSLFQSSNGKSYLASRILDTLILPLWGLWHFAVSIKATSPTFTKLPEELLTAYIKLKQDSAALDEIVQNFNFNGDEHWVFARGEMGQVKIIIRDSNLQSKGIEVKDIEERTPNFITLALVANDDVFTDFFLGLCRRWLGGGFTISGEGDGQAAFGLLFQLKVLEGILEHHSERLTRRPEQVIILVKEILDSHVRSLKKEKERLEALQNPSMNTLGRIADGREEEFSTFTPDDNDGTTSSGDAIGIALQLLNSIVSTSFSRIVSEREKKLLSTLQPALGYLSSAKEVDGSIASLTRSLALFISTQDIPLSAPMDGEVKPVDEKVLKQQQTLQTALLYLRDAMVPIRAHGLEMVKELIRQRSSVIDVPTVTKLLIDMLQDKESFVYLGVVKTLCELTDKHPGTVIGMLVRVYVDEEEKMGIDERLKVGEALMGTVQRLGETAVGKVAEEVGNALVGLAGRRKKRYREAEEIKREREEAERKIKKEGEMDEDYKKVLQEARIEAGIDGAGGIIKNEEVEDDEKWISKVGEEDYRVRTSALSVLGVLFETNAAGVPVHITLAAVEVALRTLELERGEKQATVRRAAVHLISSVLNGLESRGTVELLRVIPKERLGDIVRVLGYTRVTDDDGLVREQAGVLVETLTE